MPLRIVVDAEFFERGEFGLCCPMGELERQMRETREALSGGERTLLPLPGAGRGRNKRQQQHQTGRNNPQEDTQQVALHQHVAGSLGAQWLWFEVPPPGANCKAMSVFRRRQG
jgi:hypothetical protein